MVKFSVPAILFMYILKWLVKYINTGMSIKDFTVYGNGMGIC